MLFCLGVHVLPLPPPVFFLRGRGRGGTARRRRIEDDEDEQQQEEDPILRAALARGPAPGVLVSATGSSVGAWRGCALFLFDVIVFVSVSSSYIHKYVHSVHT